MRTEIEDYFVSGICIQQRCQIQPGGQNSAYGALGFRPWISDWPHVPHMVHTGPACWCGHCMLALHVTCYASSRLGPVNTACGIWGLTWCACCVWYEGQIQDEHCIQCPSSFEHWLWNQTGLDPQTSPMQSQCTGLALCDPPHAACVLCQLYLWAAGWCWQALQSALICARLALHVGAGKWVQCGL